jgi:hypothetical protein
LEWNESRQVDFPVNPNLASKAQGVEIAKPGNRKIELD